MPPSSAATALHPQTNITAPVNQQLLRIHPATSNPTPAHHPSSVLPGTGDAPTTSPVFALSAPTSTNPLTRQERNCERSQRAAASGPDLGVADMTGPREGLGSAFAPPRSAETRPPDPAAKSDSIATSVRLESRAAERLKCYRDAVGWTTGEVIIDALEQTIDSLPALLYPDGAIGGTLFARRGTSGHATTHTSRTPVYLRLQAEDYTVLDALVETTGARSRTHLIETALTAYLDQKERHDGTDQENV